MYVLLTAITLAGWCDNFHSVFSLEEAVMLVKLRFVSLDERVILQ